MVQIHPGQLTPKGKVMIELQAVALKDLTADDKRLLKKHGVI